MTLVATVLICVGLLVMIVGVAMIEKYGAGDE